MLTTMLPIALAIGEPGGVIELPPPYEPPTTLTHGGKRYRLDAEIPPQPAIDPELAATPSTRARELGKPVALFVNFDGITLSKCNPSNAKKNCHWYNHGVEFPPFSGSMQTRVSVLQAMRRATADLGIRVTGLRPGDDEDYVMIIYGGDEVDFGALGSAPSGDCYDQRPDEIGFAHLDGDLVDWVAGGATTALHEAGHTWGLDHIDIETGIMFPEGDNIPTGFRHECDQIVEGTDLLPVDAGSCAEVNQTVCGNPARQNDRQILEMNFGPPYVDIIAPTITLVEPADGQYFQVPGTFDVVLDIDDDLHPQVYDVRAWVDGDPPPDKASPNVEPGFRVSELPIGQWTFHVAIADAAGNESAIAFTVEVGEDPPPDPVEDGESESCACRSAGRGRTLWIGTVVLAYRRRRR